jgi:hypothetical protein
VKFGIADTKPDFLEFSSHAEITVHISKPMAKIFGILTAIVLAISAFIALKNKSATEQQIGLRDEEQSKLTQSQDELDTAKSALSSTEQQISTVKAEIPQLQQQAAQQKTLNEELTAQRTTKAAEVDPNKAKLDVIREKTATLGNIRDLAGRMSSMKGELETLTQEIAESESKLANFTSETSRLSTLVSQQQTDVERSSRGESYSDLQTNIRAIYPNWGFVTLADGNNAGVITGSTLDVMRDGERVGQLLVTAVEASTASASIVPDSVPEGTSLMSGDEVIPAVKADKSSSN